MYFTSTLQLIKNEESSKFNFSKLSTDEATLKLFSENLVFKIFIIVSIIYNHKLSFSNTIIF